MKVFVEHFRDEAEVRLLKSAVLGGSSFKPPYFLEIADNYV
jgi:hypothetical protein